MAVDTFIAYVGVYSSVADAEADYQLVKDLHTEAGLIDAYDAAVIERRDDGKVKITRKHETPTRVGGVLGGGVGLATGLVVALFPFAAIGGGLLAATAGGGAVLGGGRRARRGRDEPKRSQGAGRAPGRRPGRPGRGRDLGHGGQDRAGHAPRRQAGGQAAPGRHRRDRSRRQGRRRRPGDGR